MIRERNDYKTLSNFKAHITTVSLEFGVKALITEYYNTI